MWSLCLGLLMCFVAVLPAYFDHGERKRAFKVAMPGRAKLEAGIKWILINWGLPILALSVTVSQGIESAATDSQIRILRNNFNNATNRLAELEIMARPKSLEERIKNEFDSIDLGIFAAFSSLPIN